MSKRLQVILKDEEMRDLRRAAKGKKMTVSEWVRQALRSAGRREPKTDVGKKLDAVRVAARHAFPAGDIERMLAEIERGYMSDRSL
jgi:hypothetical protein